MKKLMILGAMIGFCSGILVGLSQGAQWPDVLWRASIVSFASSYLFRWWGGVWVRSLQEAQQERLSLANLNQAQSTKL